MVVKHCNESGLGKTFLHDLIWARTKKLPFDGILLEGDFAGELDPLAAEMFNFDLDNFIRRFS